MPLNKFIPLSPDPNITRDSDMGMAQFGHLNTIVDYLNTYVAADSLQLDGTGPLSTTLRAVTDAAGNLSPLKISTTAVQVVSPLRITTDDPSDMYLDCEDGATNNRFNITRNTASQQVNLNFASNPAGSTTIVGAVRTYVDGTNLSEVMQFREDGTIFGIGTQAANNLVIQQSNDVSNFYVYNSATWGLLTTPPNGLSNTTFNGRIIGTHGGAGNVALGLGTITADTSGSNFNIAIGQASTITTAQNGLAIGRLTSITNWSNATAIGYGAIAGANYAVAIGDSNALLQIGGNFTSAARVHIKGLGSTSATTSLLVQNSGGTQLLKITDDGVVEGGSATATQFKILNKNGLAISRDANLDANIRILEFGGVGPVIKITGNSVPTFKFLDGSNYFCIQTSPDWTGIGQFTTVANSSALLQADSTTKGFLKPRLTTAQKNAIVTPAAGLEVYDTDLNRPCFYSGSAWVTL